MQEIDFKKIEKKWQERWEKAGIFEGKISKNKKIFLTVPYPYTSGPLHIGHGRTYTVADFWIRLKRLQGFNCLWPMAFHISGTPILAISKKIEAGDKDAIKLYEDYAGIYEKDKEKAKKIVKSFTKPENVAEFFSGVIIEDFKKIGFSIDWTRQFTTGDRDYNKFIEWQFLKLKELGYIKKGEHPVQFCLNCMNAVGEDDIKDGDTLDTGIKTFTAVKFPFEDGFLLAATLRPETIFGLTNIWVNPEGTYSKISIGKENFIVSKKAAEKLKNHGFEVRKIKELSGKALIGKKASSPVENRQVPILPAHFVNTEHGTGVVYSVPAHSIDDYVALLDLQKTSEEARKIKPIKVISLPEYGDVPAKHAAEKFAIKGQSDRENTEKATKFLYREEFYNGVLANSGKFSGIKVQDIKDSVKNWMKKESKAIDFHESNTPNLVCRDGGQVIVKVLKDQWFIDYGDPAWKKKAKECLDKTFIYPEKYRGIFEHTIGWLHERACARKRGLGTKLPWDQEWVIDSLSDSTIYPAFYLAVKLIRKNKIKPESLVPEFFDFVFLGKGEPQSISKKTGMSLRILNSAREEFTYWYPVDNRHTAIPHVTNHLTFYIFNHAALFPQTLWPKSITLNELVIREGAKMGKSKGNVIPLADISEKFGADLYRLYMCAGADLDATVDWTDHNVEMMKGRLEKFFEIIGTVSQLTRAEKSGIDRWLESRFNRMILDAGKLANEFKLMGYVRKIFFEFLNELAHYFKKGGKNYVLLRKLCCEWCIILSPMIPHLSEEAWEALGNKGFVSVQKWPKYDPKKIDEKAEYSEFLADKMLSDIREVLTLIKIQNPKQINVFVSADWKYKLFEKTKNLLGKTHIMGETLKEIMKDPELKKHGKEIPQIVGSLLKDPSKIPEIILNEKEESKILEDSKAILEKEFNCKIEILAAEKSDSPRAKKAEPGKPGIEVL